LLTLSKKSLAASPAAPAAKMVHITCQGDAAGDRGCLTLGVQACTDRLDRLVRSPRSIPDERVITLVLLRRRGWNLTGQGSLLAQTPARRLCLLLITDACILLRYIVS
jgi:hypothetical protein